jgi:hypothetical protein
LQPISDVFTRDASARLCCCIPIDRPVSRKHRDRRRFRLPVLYPGRHTFVRLF